jgi:hypothetical protein
VAERVGVWDLQHDPDPGSWAPRTSAMKTCGPSPLARRVEVLLMLAAAYGMSWEDAEGEAARKRDERGGFDQRIFLEYVDQVG